MWADDIAGTGEHEPLCCRGSGLGVCPKVQAEKVTRQRGLRTARSYMIPRVCVPGACPTLRDLARVGLPVFKLLFVAILLGIGPALAANEHDPAWLGAHQLMRAQEPSGQFSFEYDFLLGGPRADTEREDGQAAYITREAGAAYGLSKYFLHERDPRVAHAIAAALRRWGQLSLPVSKSFGQDTLESTGVLALPFARYKLEASLRWLNFLYRPTGDGRLIAYGRSYDTASGGATALALLTELQYYEASHDNRFEALREAWLKGLLVLYDGVGGFRKLPAFIDENDLTNAEIWLALAYYTRLFPNDRATAATAARVDNYMLRVYTQAPNRSFYAWGVQAAALRLSATADERFRQFIAQQTHAYFQGATDNAKDNNCSTIEGLGTALHVLMKAAHSDQQLIDRLRRTIRDEMAKDLSLQIQPGQDRIDLGKGAYLYSPVLAQYDGAFLSGTRRPFVRVDYTQHCISALLLVKDDKY